MSTKYDYERDQSDLNACRDGQKGVDDTAQDAAKAGDIPGDGTECLECKYEGILCGVWFIMVVSLLRRGILCGCLCHVSRSAGWDYRDSASFAKGETLEELMEGHPQNSQSTDEDGGH